jgi:hypothetical protein
VLIAPEGSVGSGEVRGGGPGTRESDLLSPWTGTAGPQAVLLTGGSARGLAAADGVAQWLDSVGRGHPTPAVPVQGDSRSDSRVPGPPPRTSPEPTEPSGAINTVQPVRPTESVQWPHAKPSGRVTSTPASSSIDGGPC